MHHNKSYENITMAFYLTNHHMSKLPVFSILLLTKTTCIPSRELLSIINQLVLLETMINSPLTDLLSNQLSYIHYVSRTLLMHLYNPTDYWIHMCMVTIRCYDLMKHMKLMNFSMNCSIEKVRQCSTDKANWPTDKADPVACELVVNNINSVTLIRDVRPIQHG